MPFTSMANRFFEYITEKITTDEDKFNFKMVNSLLHESIEQIQKLQPNWISGDINFEELTEAVINIKKILNISTKVLNSSNEMESVTFSQLLTEMNLKNCHQNVKTEGMPVAYHSDKITVEPIANCKFHKESLIEHSIMCMIISMVKAGHSSKKYVLSGFTGLFHDIGKINTTTIYGSDDLGYPFHGAYGSALLSQYGSDELFKLLGSKQNYLDVMHTIKDHMCSYHATQFKEEWTIQRCEAARLAYSTTPQMQELSNSLSFGDTFAKIADKPVGTDFIDSRVEYNMITSAPFDCDQFMKKIGCKVPIFFIRGSSGSGKTTFIKDKLLPYLLEFFEEDRIEIISRDEIMCSVTSKLSNLTLDTKRPIGSTYSELYKIYQSKKLGKSVNDELKERISNAISQNRIAIIDSCILYYVGIKQIIPENITNAYKIAIDCNRSIPYTIKDAEKNGQTSIDELKHLYSFRNPVTWINNLNYMVLDSMYTRSKPSNLSVMPHIVFSYGFNLEHECGFETMVQVLKPVMKYFAA